MLTLALPVGGVSLWSSPASAATTSCSVASGTAIVTVDSAAGGGLTTLSAGSTGDLVVDGTACGSSFPTVINLETVAGAAPQTVRLDQNGAGGVFPCTTSITGGLHAGDVVEVDGAPGEALAAGSVGAGSGVDLASCGDPGSITGLGSIRLVAGPGAVTLSAAGGPGFTGSLGVPAVLEPADGSSQTLLPGGAGNTIDLSRVSSAVNVNVSGNQVGPTANDTASSSGGAVYSFTAFASQPLAFIGSATAPTTFDAGSMPDTYTGGGVGGTTLDFSQVAGSSLRLCTSTVSGCPAGSAQLGGMIATFSAITDFIGLPGGNTTFVSSGVGGHRFTAWGGGNVVDASPAGPGASVDAANGLVRAAGSTSPDTFVGSVSSFVGALAGATTFIAGSTSETFADPGAAAGDAIDFSHVSVATAPLIVNDSGASDGPMANDTAQAGTAIYDFTAGGAGISTFTSAAPGHTTFEVGPTGGQMLIGQGSGNQVSAATGPSAATIDAAAGSITGLSSAGVDTLRGLGTFSAFVGPSIGGTTFVAGAHDATFISAGYSNTVDFSHLTDPVAVNVSGTATAAGSSGSATSGGHTYSFASFATTPTTFVGSATAPTTYDAGSMPDTYVGGGTGGDTLDFSHVAAGSLRLCVVAATGCEAGSAQLGTIGERFSGVSNFVGLTTGDTYFATGDEPGYTFTGLGPGNVLDLRSATTPVVDLAGGTVTGLASSGHDTIAGIEQLEVGLHAQSAAPADATVGGSYDPAIAGTGSANPVVLSIDPTTTNDACALDGSGAVLFTHVGSCVLDANQQGDSHFATAAQLTQTFAISQGASRTEVSVTPGALTATVAPTGPHAPVPTGTVTFTVDGAVVGSQPLDAGGIATLPYTIPAGSHHVVHADYSGDADLTVSAGSVERRDPTITVHLSSAHPATPYGWYRSPVTLSFTCTPQGSPLAGSCPSPALLSTDGASQSATGSVNAEDGGHGAVTADGINIDQIPPTVSVSGVTSGSHYAAWAPKASCAGVDALSGALRCSVRTTTKATAAGWTVSYTGAAPDRAGNIGRTSGTYAVTRYGVSGATYARGDWVVRLAHRYVVVAVSRPRPTLLGPAPGNRTPAGRAAPFRRTGSVHGLPVWSASIRIPGTMRAHPVWSYDVKIGRTNHLVRVRLA